MAGSEDVICPLIIACCIAAVTAHPYILKWVMFSSGTVCRLIYVTASKHSGCDRCAALSGYMAFCSWTAKPCLKQFYNPLVVNVNKPQGHIYTCCWRGGKNRWLSCGLIASALPHLIQHSSRRGLWVKMSPPPRRIRLPVLLAEHDLFK